MRADWYRNAFIILHVDHHTRESFPVGRDADEEQTLRLIELASPDVLQIHAKGNPGWTTYPTRVGFTPPHLERDVLAVWTSIARRLDKPFSAYFNLGRDREIMQRRPEWNRVDQGGTPDDNMLSYATGVSEHYLLPMIGEIMERYAPSGFWFDGSCFTVKACWRDESLSRWRDSGHGHVPRSALDPAWDAYKEMHREIYREFVRETARQIHARNERCLLAVNVAYGLLMPERPDPQIDYLTQDIADNVERIGPSASIRDAQRLPFDFMVTLWASDRKMIGAQGSTVPKTLEQLQQEAAVIISRGGRFSAWDNPTDGSGLVEERMRLFGDLSGWLRSRQAWCMETVNAPDVTVLHTPQTHYANTRARRECFVNSAPAVETASAFLDELHLPHEVVPGWRLEDGAVDSRLLVVEHPHVLTESQLGGMKDYALAGGAVLLTGDAAVVGGPELRALCGISSASVEPEQLTLRIEAEPGIQVTLPWYGCALDPDAGAEVALWGRSRSRVPLLVCRKTGAGTFWFSPVPLFTSLAEERAAAGAAGMSPDPRSPAAGLAELVLAAVLPERSRRIITNASRDLRVAVRERVADDGSRMFVVHMVNRSPGRTSVGPLFPRISDIPPLPNLDLAVLLDRPLLDAVLEPDGGPATYDYRDGRLHVRVPGFPMHLMLVVRLAPVNCH